MVLMAMLDITGHAQALRDNAVIPRPATSLQNTLLHVHSPLTDRQARCVLHVHPCIYTVFHTQLCLQACHAC